MPWFAYFLRCRDGSLYGGVTSDVARRLAAHQAGRGARYTRARLPVELAWDSPGMGKVEAHRLEYRIKRLDRRAKLALVRGDGRLLADLLAQVALRQRSSTVRPASARRARRAAGSASVPPTTQRRITPAR
jgi:putative endonuclease